jgi:hypothetical protein
MMTSIVDDTYDRDKDCCKFCLSVGGQSLGCKSGDMKTFGETV